jgi:Cu(I)/Ag(I) efflux system protein CusF
MNPGLFSRIALILALSLPLVPHRAEAFTDDRHGCMYLASADHGAHGAHTQAVETKEAATYTATGIVESVNEPQGKITITHDPVPALNWPKMTMRFTPESPSLIEGLRKGDKVRLDFQNQGGVSRILHIEVMRQGNTD